MDTALAFRIFLLSLVCLLVTACSRDTDVQFPEAFVKADVDCSVPDLSTPLVNSFEIDVRGKDDRVATVLLSDGGLFTEDLDYSIFLPFLADEINVTLDVLDPTTTDSEQPVNFLDSDLEGVLVRQLLRYRPVDPEVENYEENEEFQLDDNQNVVISDIAKFSFVDFTITSNYEFVEDRPDCQNLGVTRGDADNEDEPVIREIEKEYVLSVEVFVPDDFVGSGTVPAEALTGYGSSVTTDGRFFAVGAPLDDLAPPTNTDPDNETGFIPTGQTLPTNMVMDSGAVYLYEGSTDGLNYCGMIKAFNAGANDHFGAQVLIRDSYLYVSAPLEDGGASGVFRPVPANADLFYDRVDSGALYVYQISDACVAAEYAYIKNPENSANFARPQAYFGSALAEDAGDVFVGAPNQVNSGNDAIVEGAVYHFRRSGDSWLSGLRYETAVQHNNELFGSSLAVADGYLYVGAPGDGVVASALPLNDGSVPIATITSGSFGNINTASGAVQVFERNDADSIYAPISYLKPSNNEAGDRFGTALDAVANSVFVGAPFEDGGSSMVNTDLDDNSLENSGAVYHFDYDMDTGLKLRNYIKSGQVSEQAKFGSILSAERRYLAVANPDVVEDFFGAGDASGHFEIIDYVKFEDPEYFAVIESAISTLPIAEKIEALYLYGGFLVVGIPDAEVGGVSGLGWFAAGN